MPRSVGLLQHSARLRHRDGNGDRNPAAPPLTRVAAGPPPGRGSVVEALGCDRRGKTGVITFPWNTRTSAHRQRCSEQSRLSQGAAMFRVSDVMSRHLVTLREEDSL